MKLMKKGNQAPSITFRYQIEFVGTAARKLLGLDVQWADSV